MARRSFWRTISAIAVLGIGSGVAGQEPEASRLRELNARIVEAHRAGDYERSVELAEEALAVTAETYGERHPHTITSLEIVALLYQSQGRYDEAEAHYVRAFEFRRETLGLQHSDTLTSLNNLAGLYHSQGRYDEAEPLYARALEQRRESLGERHPDTLSSLNHMALLYQAQGRYSEAEPLYARALELRRDSLGERHPDTLISLNNMAFLYARQGRYGEAEPLFVRALELRRETLGERHPDTLTSLMNLAGIYVERGRYGEAEPLLVRALELHREILGEYHPNSLISLNEMAALYLKQGRYDKAEPLFERALKLRRKTLGEHHPDTLISLNNMAVVYVAQHRYDKAEPLYASALAVRRETLGERHPDTLASLNNMAFLYESRGRYERAEPLYARALELSRETLGERHPNTLRNVNNMAFLYVKQGRHDAAEPLYARALELRRETLGPQHPDTLNVHFNATSNLAALDRTEEAARLLAQMEGPLLTWLGAEIYATESTAVARALVASQRTYQDAALSLAIRAPDEDRAREVAASALLRFKGLQAEEEAMIARLVRRGRDDAMGALALEIRSLRAGLARGFHAGGDPEAVAGPVRSLDGKERALGRLSRDYRDQLKVREANLADLQGALTGGRTLVEFARYRPADFDKGSLGADRWAAVVIAGYARLEVVDLGPVADTAAQIARLVGEGDGADDAAKALFDRFIAPLGLDPEAPVVIAPDAALHLLPFHRLMSPDGSPWGTTRDVRIVQTGRDLLRPPHDAPATGLLAIGAVDFEDMMAEVTDLAPDPLPPTLVAEAERSRAGAAEAFRSGFKPLPGSRREIDEIEALYRSARPAEPVAIWRGAEATEARLSGLAQPPRVLHLATHGFYRAAKDAADRPMLLSGIALAGANRALATEGEDGLLYALEAQGLNLEGTELVVLSACETAQGVIGHGEGVYGLVRALRTAGAQNVLVTLRSIGDESAADFMRQFYSAWLSQPPGQSDPAAALQATRQHFIATDPDFDWAPFVLIGNG